MLMYKETLWCLLTNACLRVKNAEPFSRTQRFTFRYAHKSQHANLPYRDVRSLLQKWGNVLTLSIEL